MANALRELFTNIASAIKEKTGDNATMKPAEFPDKIRSIDVSETLEDLPIALDFSGGDQEVVAPDGFVVKSAVIQKPDTLIPENIAGGVDIAGIVGTLATGGSGGSKYAHGTFKASGATHTLAHNLGCIPDFIVFFITSGFTSPTAGASILSVGVSEKFASMLGMTEDYQWCRYYNSYSSTTKSSTTSPDYTIETTQASALIRDTTESTVVLGSSSGSGSLQSGGTYEWYAFAL